MLSTLYNRVKEVEAQTTHNPNDLTQDEVTAKALQWMIQNCQTPRSVDIALQSLAGATQGLHRVPLVQSDAWTLVKRRLDYRKTHGRGSNSDPGHAAHAQALQSIIVCQDEDAWLDYGSKAGTKRQESLVLGLQSCIDQITIQGAAYNVETKRLLQKCSTIGVQLLKRNNITPVRAGAEDKWEAQQISWGAIEDPEHLSNEITNHLERHLKVEVDLVPTVYTVLCASLGLLLCCNMADGHVQVSGAYVMRLLRAYVPRMDHLYQVYAAARAPNGSRAADRAFRVWDEYTARDREVSFLLGLLPTSCPIPKSNLPGPNQLREVDHSCLETVIERIWQFLIAVTYSDADAFNHPLQRVSGIMHLLANHSRYNLSPEDCTTIQTLAMGGSMEGCPRLLDAHSRTQFTQLINRCLDEPVGASENKLALQFAEVLLHYMWSWPTNERFIPSPTIYVWTVRSLCQAQTIEEKKGFYALITSFPFPKMSPSFVQLLSANEMVSELAGALNNNDPTLQAFAAAQLWLLFNMSVQFGDRTSETLTMLENALLKYPLPDEDLSKQELAAERLESQLQILLAEPRNSFSTELGDFNDSSGNNLFKCAYLYRILECMLQKRNQPLPERAEKVLENVPLTLRGLNSSLSLEGETKI
ncbi:hypothetical protein B0J17DRAFT_721743 [Rhizoctonia solani]|nr:hypothetical protein B0J17DRAFT_721743 [Rhizoctonia solani]